MLTIKRTNGDDPDFIALIRELDKHLWQIYGKEMEYFGQFNFVSDTNTVVLAYVENAPVACGCFRAFDADTVEVKRMFVRPDQRVKGTGAAILTALEEWAKELGYKNAILETGRTLQPAVNLYKKHRYEEIEDYGPYVGIEESVCMKKTIA